MPDETSPTPDSTATQAATTPDPSLRSVVDQKKTIGLKQGTKKAGAAPAGARKGISYADAGVDITSADRSKQRIKMLARKTFNRQVLSEIGGFGGLFALDLESFPTLCWSPRLTASARN